MALIEAAVSVIRREGNPWLPHAMPGSGWATGYVMPAAFLAAAVVSAFGAVAVWRAARQAVARHGGADVATYVAALMASAVSAQGMWVYFATVLHAALPLRCLVFAFIDVAIFALALRARENMRKFAASGVDGLLMWFFTAVSALLASAAATSGREVLIRLLVPIGAALLWERALVTERRLRNGDGSGGTWWKKLQVRLGLADPMARAVGDAGQDHLISVLAQAIHRYNRTARVSRANGLRLKMAERRADAAMQRAMQRTALWSSPQLQKALSTQVRMLGSVRQLARLEGESPWSWLPDADYQQDEGNGPGAIEELIGDLTAAQRFGDHAEIRKLLNVKNGGVSDIAVLVRCAVATGAPKRVLAAIALHAGEDQFSSNAAARQWIADASGQDNYLPDVREISRTRKMLFPELGTTGDQPAAGSELEPVAA